MRKTILFLAMTFMAASTAFAQKHNDHVMQKAETKMNAAKGMTEKVSTEDLNPAWTFNTEEHDFGTIAEGPAVSFDFEFTNNGTEPIKLQTVQASCGCTTPNWSKEEIMPGESSKITATYNTQGRPNGFNKTITVKSNVGQKVLRIKGNVEKAPTSSVPTNNNSMIKH